MPFSVSTSLLDSSHRSSLMTNYSKLYVSGILTMLNSLSIITRTGPKNSDHKNLSNGLHTLYLDYFYLRCKKTNETGLLNIRCTLRADIGVSETA